MQTIQWNLIPLRYCSPEAGHRHSAREGRLHIGSGHTHIGTCGCKTPFPKTIARYVQKPDAWYEQVGFGDTHALRMHRNGVRALLKLVPEALKYDDMKRFSTQLSNLSEDPAHELPWTLTLSQGGSLLSSEPNQPRAKSPAPETSLPRDMVYLPEGFRAIKARLLGNELKHVLADHGRLLSLFEKADDGRATSEETKYLLEYNAPIQMQNIASCISRNADQLEVCILCATMVMVAITFHNKCFGTLWFQLRKDLVLVVTSGYDVAQEEEDCFLWCKFVALTSCTKLAGLDKLGLTIAANFRKEEIQRMESWPDFRKVLRRFLWPKQMDAQGKQAWHQLVTEMRLRKLKG